MPSFVYRDLYAVGFAARHGTRRIFIVDKSQHDSFTRRIAYIQFKRQIDVIGPAESKFGCRQTEILTEYGCRFILIDRQCDILIRIILCDERISRDIKIKRCVRIDICRSQRFKNNWFGDIRKIIGVFL